MKIKKLIIIATFFLCCCLIGCGKKKETEYIDGFEVAEYDKFNSYASENGLGGTLICVKGKVLNQTKIEETDSEIPLLAIVIEQTDGNRWSVSVTSETEIKEIQNKNVRVFGTYQGFSDFVNLPGLSVTVNDESMIEKARIEVEEDGKYKEAWNYYKDYAKQEIEQLDSETEESEEEIIDTFEWNYDENNGLTIGLFKNKTTEKLSIAAFGNYTQENAGLMYNNYLLIFAMSSSSGIDFNIGFTVGENTYISFMNDGTILSDNFPKVNEDISETYNDSAKEFSKTLDEFFIKNELKEKNM